MGEALEATFVRLIVIPSSSSAAAIMTDRLLHRSFVDSFRACQDAARLTTAAPAAAAAAISHINPYAYNPQAPAHSDHYATASTLILGSWIVTFGTARMIQRG